MTKSGGGPRWRAPPERHSLAAGHPFEDAPATVTSGVRTESGNPVHPEFSQYSISAFVTAVVTAILYAGDSNRERRIAELDSGKLQSHAVPPELVLEHLQNVLDRLECDVMPFASPKVRNDFVKIRYMLINKVIMQRRLGSLKGPLN